jgi:arylsulfatase A-like enzyme
MKTILIDIDSLRPDHLGCYGYFKETSPEIDSLAEDSLVFEKAYTCASPSLPSRAAVFSGRYPESNGVVTHGPQGQEMNSPYNWSYERKEEWEGDLRNWWNLPELLFHNEINCCAVSSFGRYPVPWLFRTWTEFIQPRSSMENGTHATVDGEKVREKALNWLEDNKEEDFFLYVQFWDPHVPCLRSEEEITEVSDELPEYLEEADFESEGSRSAEKKGIEDSEDLREMVQRYDAEIRHVDRQISELIDFLKQKGLYEETNVILTGDHGEEFGENGVFREHWSSFEGTQRIPLIAKLSDKEPARIKKKVSNIDIAPTVADLYGLEKPEKWDGKPIKERLEDSNWERTLLTMHGLYTAQRALITGRFKYVKTLHPGIRPEMEEEMLFNLEEDPYRQRDISGHREDLLTDFRELMDEMVEERIDGDDPVSGLADEGPYGWKWNRG